MGKRTPRSNRGTGVSDPFAVLGLSHESTLDDIEDARRSLAKSAHPDIGGSVGDMQRINAAADEATRIVVARAGSRSPTRTGPPPASPPPAGGPQFHWRVDHPSFTVEALPAQAFEALLVVASWLGETIDDEPPYRLDVEMTEPFPAWCRLDLVPDAGATTVSVTVGSERGVSATDVDAVRDAWIAALNSLDWEEIGGSLRQP